jgi:hypothetical protein
VDRGAAVPWLIKFGDASLLRLERGIPGIVLASYYLSALRLTLVVMARLVRASEHASAGTCSSTCRDRWPGQAGP